MKDPIVDDGYIERTKNERTSKKMRSTERVFVLTVERTHLSVHKAKAIAESRLIQAARCEIMSGYILIEIVILH